MTFRFDLDKEYGEKLIDAANKQHMTVQDYIRYKLFNIGNNKFTVEEAMKRVRSRNQDPNKDSEFSLPELYGEEWTLGRGHAGAFGRTFFEYINNHPEEGVRFLNMGKYGRIATYIYKPGRIENE